MKHLYLVALILLSVAVKAQLNITLSGTSFCNWDSSTTGPGTITCAVTGGIAPYTYAWSNGSTTMNQNQLSPGTYCLTVADNNNNTATACYTVTPVVTAQTHVVNETCNNADGKAWVDIAGGTLPYSIVWCCPNQFGDTAFNLATGSYSVTVTDSQGCTPLSGNWWFGSPLFVSVGRDLPFSYTITSQPHNCPQMGSAAVHVTGGTPPYSYTWSTTPSQTTDSIGGLHGGLYFVTISDATFNCSTVDTVPIPNIQVITGIVTSTPEFCILNNGTATALAQSGTPPYTYVWNTTPPQTGNTATGLSTGVYTVTIADANNCSETKLVQVGYQSPIKPNLVVVNEKCNDNSGSATVTPQLGTAPYTYAWSNSSSNPSITGLTSGAYSVTISDTQGCTVAAGGYVQDVPSFTVTLSKTGTQCNANTGTATVNVTGATGPFTYLWNTVPPQTTQTATGLGTGGYQCKVTDAQGCFGYYSTSIVYSTILNASINTTPATCLSATGSATASVSGGQSPYTYKWNTNATSASITSLTPGNYSILITDANGCTASKSKQVNSISNVQAGIVKTNASCIYINDGSAVASSVNTTAPVTYHWSNGQNTITVANLNVGWIYRVTVTDAIGCSATAQTGVIGYQGIACAAQVSGKVVNDKDKDCTWTTGDEGIPQTAVQAIPGFYDYTNALGDYNFVLPAGSYLLNHTLPYHTYPLCPTGAIVLQNLGTGSVTTNNNFYDTVRTALDLSVNYGYPSPPRPGFPHTVNIYARNLGNVTATATIEYTYDADVTYVSSLYTPVHDIANRKLYFTVSNMLPNAENVVNAVFNVAATTPLGTDVDECVNITPVQNDVDFTNNEQCRNVKVVGSYDPNDKQVTPVGSGIQKYIERSDSVLTYTIRFQNTGTYSAQNVVILDTLDTDLDFASINRIYASHKVRPDFFQNKILAFYFDDIYLPDSFSNEPLSHGFVTFSIKVKPNLPHNTPIKNKGAIYFDYNEPIITNEVLNTINDPTGIVEKPRADWRLYPNPTQGYLRLDVPDATAGEYRLTVTDIIGRTIYTESKQLLAGNNQIELNLSDKNEGIYLLQITGPNANYSVKKFVLEHR